MLLGDREIFEWLETTLVPRLIDAASDSDLRVWCVDCPASEDAYALAMLLRDAAGQRGNIRSVDVIASGGAASRPTAATLAQARDGFYPKDVVYQVAEPWRRRLFVRENARYRVRRDLRKLVTFSAHDLFADAPLARVHLIVCGELLTGLAQDVHRDVLELFHYTLEPQGLLLLGHGEALEDHDLFICENASRSLFRRRAAAMCQLALPTIAANPGGRPVPRSGDAETDAPGEAVHAALTDGDRRRAVLAALADELKGPLGPISASLQLPAARPSRAVASTAQKSTPFAGYRVLIVDDNADAVEALGMLVGVLGCSDVRMALDGVEALEVAADFKPDVMLLDLSLPRMSGFDVAARIRREPWGRNVILVAVTGWGQDKDKERTKAAGFDHHITKPADSSALEAVLAAGRPTRLGSG